MFRSAWISRVGFGLHAFWTALLVSEDSRRLCVSRRSLLAENLEPRQLLAGDVTTAFAGAPFTADTASTNDAVADVRTMQNPVNRFDVNNDQRVSPADALATIDYISQIASGEHVDVGPSFFPDVNGDSRVSPADALATIDFISVRYSSQSTSPQYNALTQSSGTTFTITETNGVASIDLTDGTMINDAFVALHSHIGTSPTASSGVVNVLASTTFDASLVAQDNVRLNLPDGVTLTLNSAAPLPLTQNFGAAIDLSNTTDTGLTGGGTLALDGLARYAVYGVAVQGTEIGNVDSTDPNPTKLKITGWQYGVFLASSSTTATQNVNLVNLEVTDPHTSHVEFPITVTNRPGVNGPWATGVTMENVLVDGGQPDGNGGKMGGAHGTDNAFTADQIVLQGVDGATLNNIVSLRGGENGLTVSWGSTNVTLTNVTIDEPDAHAFNVGGGSQALDVVDATGFTQGLAVQGLTSGTTGEVFKSFTGRVWVANTAGNRFEPGETLQAVDNSVSTQINTIYRTSNVTIDNANTSNAGLNVNQVANAGGLLAFSDVYIQQADDVLVQNSTFDSIGRDDGNGGRAPHFGINAAIALNVELSGNTFVDYGNNQSPVVLSANTTQIAGSPEQNTINATPNDDQIIATQFADVFDGFRRCRSARRPRRQ